MPESDQNRPLDLRTLSEGMPGLTPEVGGGLAQAAAVCLEHNSHPQGVCLDVEGAESACFAVSWTPATDQVRRTHADLQDATEHGACGVAIAISREVTGKQVVEQSWKGRGKGRGFGFDYWLGDVSDDLVFTRDLRLEVSGVLNGSSSDVKRRLKEKVEQVSRFGNAVPGLAVVVAFAQPKAFLGQP